MQHVCRQIQTSCTLYVVVVLHSNIFHIWFSWLLLNLLKWKEKIEKKIWLLEERKCTYNVEVWQKIEALHTHSISVFFSLLFFSLRNISFAQICCLWGSWIIKVHIQHFVLFFFVYKNTLKEQIVGLLPSKLSLSFILFFFLV